MAAIRPWPDWEYLPVKPSPSPAFDAPDIASRLAAMAGPEFDALPFGVVEMNIDFVVLRYNSTESRYSGLSPERVVGRQFFREVAPCADNRHVARRYELPVVDESIQYTFSLRMKPSPVTLRMLKPGDGERIYLLVMWP
jgi:photoactive yellow protein